MIQTNTVLVYVEDPGACNYLRELPAYLALQGLKTELIASGAGVEYLTARGSEFQSVDPMADASQLLDERKPTLVIVGTSEQTNTLSLRLLDECRRRNILSIGVVDMQSNVDRRFRGASNDPLAYAPHWLIVPDEACKLEFAALNFPNDRIFVGGHPHFDYVYELGQKMQEKKQSLRKTLFPRAKNDQLVITFICEGYDLLNRSASLKSDEYTIKGRGASDFRTAVVVEELLDAIKTLHIDAFVVLRFHPKMQGDELDAYLKEVDYISKKEDPIELLFASDLIVGMSSMLLQEAAVMGLQTLAILPRATEKAFLPTTANGHTPTALTRETLLEFLSAFANGSAPKLQVKLPFKRHAIKEITNFVKQLLDVHQQLLSSDRCKS